MGKKSDQGWQSAPDQPGQWGLPLHLELDIHRWYMKAEDPEIPMGIPMAEVARSIRSRLRALLQANHKHRWPVALMEMSFLTRTLRVMEAGEFHALDAVAEDILSEARKAIADCP
jgi:hypothetical protein